MDNHQPRREEEPSASIMGREEELDKVSLTSDYIDELAELKWVRAGCTGATSAFIGTTRDHFQGREVTTLFYEAYDSMAIKEMKKLCLQMRERWQDLHKISIVHRIGEVPVGEASVMIVASAAHRKGAIEAVDYCIDTLKQTVPIWKKEIYGDGQGKWKSNCPGCAPHKHHHSHQHHSSTHF
eukprot:m.81253 g.81253  ORF g.81253 m.81253 type:complete len:182 (+) comp14242_c0_seq1:166-711(+)